MPRGVPGLTLDRERPRRFAVTTWLALSVAFAVVLWGGDSLRARHLAVWSAPPAEFALVPTVAFVSTRHDLVSDPLAAAEIYLMDEGTLSNVRRVTENEYYDAFPTISPDGKRILFDSNLPVEGRPPSSAFNPDLWVMKSDGTERAYIDHGASGTWSRDSKHVAYHASASGTGQAIRNDPSAATIDSDIFTANLDDMVAGVAQRVNLTNSPLAVDEDPDWSPTADVIVYTSHSATSNHANPTDAEIYVRNADDTAGPGTRLTFNSREERAPAWSPDGTLILYVCKEFFDEATQTSLIVGPDFEICVMNADGTGQKALTNNAVGDLTPNWSTDGTQIFFHRNLPTSVGGVVQVYLELFRMNADGSGITQLTFPPTDGHNAFANAGAVRIKVN